VHYVYAPDRHLGFFMAAKADLTYMQRALALAEKGRGKTSPNPMVGAVIVRAGKIVGEGYHRMAGSDHAEIAAIKKARGKTKGATLYVTLEPCCHVGRTGPCTEAIIGSGIKRVVLPLKDPNPVVNGKGIRHLRKAGIEVTIGVMKKEAALLNDAYLGYYYLNRPYVILKTAQTLDGRIAARGGDSRWITDKESRKLAHELRAEVDAVVIGSGTVAADDPSLTVRHVNGSDPYRIILTGSAKIPPGSAVITNNQDMKTILVSSKRRLSRISRAGKSKNLILWEVKTERTGLIDLKDFLEKAAAFGLRTLLVEGGARLATSFLKANLVDKFVAITAPKVLGEGIEAVGDLEIKKVSQAIEFDNPKFVRSGRDMVFVGYPRRKK